MKNQWLLLNIINRLSKFYFSWNIMRKVEIFFEWVVRLNHVKLVSTVNNRYRLLCSKIANYMFDLRHIGTCFFYNSFFSILYHLLNFSFWSIKRFFQFRIDICTWLLFYRRRTLEFNVKMYQSENDLNPFSIYRSNISIDLEIIIK